MHFSYQRFVVNQLRQRFGFEGAPVRVFYKAKRRTERAERVIARAEAAGTARPASPNKERGKKPVRSNPTRQGRSR